MNRLVFFFNLFTQKATPSSLCNTLRNQLLKITIDDFCSISYLPWSFSRLWRWQGVRRTGANSWNSSRHCSFAVGRHPWQHPSGSKQMPPTPTSLWSPSADSQSHPHPRTSSSNPASVGRVQLLRSGLFVADNGRGQVWNFQQWLKKPTLKSAREKSLFLKGGGNVVISTHTHHGASETVGIGSGLQSLSTGVSVFIKQGSLVSLTPALLHILMIKMFTEVCLSKTLPSPVRSSCAMPESISRFPHRCLHIHDCNGMEFNDMNMPVGAAPWASCLMPPLLIPPLKLLQMTLFNST